MLKILNKINKSKRKPNKVSDSYVNEYMNVEKYKRQIVNGMLLQNEDIEVILKMNPNNIRMILELYNKSLYNYTEYVKNM
jgi:hypothetical protein